jgi:hypothetical protein
MTWTRGCQNNLPSGTGPLVWEEEGMTASVRDIISRIDAKDPRIRVFRPELTRLVLSSSTSRGAVGRAAFANVSNESCVTTLRERLPGSRVRHEQYISTTSATSRAVPHSIPPSIQRSRLRRINPSTSGCIAIIVPKRRISQSCKSPPVWDCVRP